MKKRSSKNTCSCCNTYDGEYPHYQHCSLCLEPLAAVGVVIEIRNGVPWYYHTSCYDILASLRAKQDGKTATQKKAAYDNDKRSLYDIVRSKFSLPKCDPKTMKQVNSRISNQRECPPSLDV